MHAQVAVILWSMALFCMWNWGALAAGTADLLRFAVTTDSNESSNRYVYHTFSYAAYTVQPGDCIEYDVYLTRAIDGLGGIEVYSTSHPEGWRDLLGWRDQNNISGHPAADLSGCALFKWYHRVLTVPAGEGGSTIAKWDVAAEWDAPGLTATAYYDNIVITRGGVPVTTIYECGAPPANELDFQADCSSYQLSGGPSRAPGTYIGTQLFYWYDAPGGADTSQYIYDPPGMDAPYPGTNEWYSSLNQSWCQRQLGDMKLAGIDYILPDNFGNSVGIHNRTGALENLVNAILDTGSDQRVAIFQDGWNHVCEWNEDRGRGYVDNPPMPITLENWHYFYELSIRPFYQLIPRSLWATHNGLPVHLGGRPLLVVYTIYYFDPSSFEWADDLWADVKSKFLADFGITPWLVLDESWFNENPSVAAVADGETLFGPALYGMRTFNVDGYVASELGPGYDDRLIRNPGQFRPREDDRWLTSSYNLAPESHLLIIETWNELLEGTGIERCLDYPAMAGGLLPEDYYITALHNLRWTKPGVREWDLTFLSYSLPVPLTLGTAISFSLRNDGMTPWPANDVCLVGRLLDPATNAEVRSANLAQLGRTVLHGETTMFDAVVPGDWPTGNHRLEIDLQVSSQSFASLGDTPLQRPVAIAQGGVMGTVSDSGQPLHYATIRAFQGNVEVGRASTRPDGTYQLGLAAGSYRLECRKYGHVPWPAIVRRVTVPSSSFVIINFSLTVQQSTDVIVDFSEVLREGVPVDGMHPRPFPNGIDFGTNQWIGRSAWGGLNNGECIGMITSMTDDTKTISLPAGKRLKRIAVGGEGMTGRVTFSAPGSGNPDRTVNLTTCPRTYALNWPNPSPTVNIRVTMTDSRCAGSIPFDDLVIGD